MLTHIHPPTAAHVEAAFEWLDTRIDKATAAADNAPYAALGSPEWCALPDNDPRRWLAVLGCARAWYLDLNRIPEKIRAEVAEVIELADYLIAERDRIDAEIRRQVVKEATAAMERHAREVKRRGTLPNKTGPEAIADAHASWGLPLPRLNTPSLTVVRDAA